MLQIKMDLIDLVVHCKNLKKKHAFKIIKRMNASRRNSLFVTRFRKATILQHETADIAMETNVSSSCADGDPIL